MQSTKRPIESDATNSSLEWPLAPSLRSSDALHNILERLDYIQLIPKDLLKYILSFLRFSFDRTPFAELSLVSKKFKYITRDMYTHDETKPLLKRFLLTNRIDQEASWTLSARKYNNLFSHSQNASQYDLNLIQFVKAASISDFELDYTTRKNCSIEQVVLDELKTLPHLNYLSIKAQSASQGLLKIDQTFITQFTISDSRIDHLDISGCLNLKKIKLLRLPNIKDVVLPPFVISLILKNVTCNGLGNLEKYPLIYLKVHYSHIQSSLPTSLTELHTELAFLPVSNNLRSLTQLNKLHLGNNKFSELFLPDSLSELFIKDDPNIDSENHLSQIHIANSSLRWLHLVDIGEIDYAILPLTLQILKISECFRLFELDLTQHLQLRELTILDSQGFAGISLPNNFGGLRNLKIKNCMRDNKHFINFKCSLNEATATQLKKVILSKTLILFFPYSISSTIKSLTIENCPFLNDRSEEYGVSLQHKDVLTEEEESSLNSNNY